MAVLIENLQNNIEVTDKTEKLIRRAVETALEIEEFDTPSEISIMLVDDLKIREINKEQRNIDKATDVLSFPMVEMFEGQIISNEGDFDLDENLLLLGDIIVSMDKTMEQSREYGHSFERELAFLATHGVFHLLGYDHEEEEMENKMMEKQEKVLAMMDLKRI
jgi:probable rRNA maturation factor